MNGSICQVIKNCDHSGGLFLVGDGLIGKSVVAGGYLFDVTRFQKGCSPVHFPVLPHLIDGRATVPFAPRGFHAAIVYHSFVAGQYHGSLGDGDACVKHKGLAIFLFASVGG